MSLKKDQIIEIETLRAEGCTWNEVALRFNEEYGTDYNRDSMRLKYNYYAADEPDFDNVEELKKQRRSQVTALDARKKLRKSLDAQIQLDDIMKELKKVAGDIKKLPKVKMAKRVAGKMPLTEECLIGDIQIGKIMEDYNSEICRKRMEEHAQSIVMKIKQHQKTGYNVERIVVPMLGDMIEHSEKHPNSARATDCSTPEQMRLITVYLFHYFIRPLAELGIPMDIKCVTGNHDWGGHGLQMFYPGREHLSWMFYHLLEELCKVAGLTHVKFEIAEGSFLTYEIYGHTVLIEHGVGIAANEASMAKKLNSRIRQVKKHISFFRIGDKHCCNIFNNGQYMVNGAYFGKDEKGVEYSGILGYYSPPSQIMCCYVPRKKDDPRSPLYDMFVIQLGHVR